MNCPDCNQGLMTYHEADSVEPHGEGFHDTWYECDKCGYRENAE